MLRMISTALLGTLAIGLFADDAESRRGRRGFGPGLRHGQTSSGPVLSLDELTYCVGEEYRIASDGYRLDREAEEIEDVRQRLDRTSARQVRWFNDKVAAFNASAQSADTDVQAFNERCAGKSYYERDMVEARKAANLPDFSALGKPVDTGSTPPWLLFQKKAN